MHRSITLAMLVLFVAAPTLPRAAELASAAAPRHAYSAIESVGWSYRDEHVGHGSADGLQFFLDDHFNSTVDPDDGSDVKAIVAAIERVRPGDPVSFSLTREAGKLACSGRAEQGGRASGTCRFEPDQGFAAALARRGIPPEDSDTLLGLTLVDARLATVDGLAAEGFRFDDAGDLIAVSALGVTAAYADELRATGLKIAELGDLIAAKALKIDPQWLADMARAGYPNLAVDQAIQMRALGVTPEYAMKMARVLRAVGEIE